MQEEIGVGKEKIMASFLEKLRMDNIYGGMGGDGSSIEPFIQSIMASSQPSPMNLNPSMLTNIGGRIAAPETEEPRNEIRNTVFQDIMTPYQQAQIDLRRQELGQRKEIESERQQTQQERTNIQKQRADVYEFKSKNPNVRIIEQRGGNTIAINPATGETIRDFGPSGFLDEQEKIQLQQEGALERIGATGEQQRETATMRGEIERGNIGLRGEEARRTKIAPSEIKEELPTQTRVRQFNAARELYNSNPELRPFIKLSGNDFQITSPGTGFFGPTGPTKEQYDKINQTIFSGALSRQAPLSERATTVEPIYKTQRNTRTGETRRVMSTDGGKTWNPAPAGK